MKRRDVLTAFAGAAATALSGHAAGAAGEGGARKKIYMVTFRGDTEAEAGFRDYIRASGLAADIVTRDVARDIGRAKGIAEEIRQARPDLVYTWGTPLTLALAGRHDDPAPPLAGIPVVFAIVSTPVQSKIAASLDRPGGKVTGAIHVVPTSVQMRTIETYRSFKTIGMIYNAQEPNSVIVRDEVAEYCRGTGARLVERVFPLGPDGKPSADRLEEFVRVIKRDGAEWLYISADTFLGGHYPRLIDALVAEKLPSFGAVEFTIRQGAAMFGLICRYYSIGQLAGAKAVQILRDGKDPGSIPIETLKRYSLIINIGLAKKFEFYPPLSLLSYAEIIGA